MSAMGRVSVRRWRINGQRIWRRVVMERGGEGIWRVGMGMGVGTGEM